jgi:hypothetical protein
MLIFRLLIDFLSRTGRILHYAVVFGAAFGVVFRVGLFVEAKIVDFMAETLQLQQQRYEELYGVPMTEQQISTNYKLLVCLQGLYFQDEESVKMFSDTDYWEDLSDGHLHVTTSGLNIKKTAKFESCSSAEQEKLDSQGCAILRSVHIRSELFPILQQTIRNLVAHKWPPSFIFLYDEVWTELIEPLWDVYNHLLGEGCWMESDLNCWCLRIPKSERDAASGIPHKAGNYIGANFGNAHRDMRYDACHGDDEKFTSLNAWVAINPAGATTENGCMRVIPLENDDFFYSPDHPYHMNTAKALSFMEDQVAFCN